MLDATHEKAKNSPFTKKYAKRSYNFRNFVRDVVLVLQSFPDMFKTRKSNAISSKFGEHVMLAVTSVNRCKYCSWVHSRLALQAGCTKAEIKAILDSDMRTVNNTELVALAFAQHYAESGGKPDVDAARKLLHVYGKTGTRTILSLIRMIMLGNLTGNTLDAFQARINGIKVEGGSIFLEFIVFLIGKPITTLFNFK